MPHRKPFSLGFSGVADAFTGSRSYGVIHGRTELLATAPDAALWDHWERACRKVRRRPRILPTEPEHARMWLQIMDQTPPARDPVNPSTP